mmetsp:Transcript_46909/g.116924  ORF Transcript_46909/g.116924 Transcript_46909/m.116924 type:complete len:264 (-) Transcript_46909:221-1012(-)
MAYASWSHCQATYSGSLTSGPNIFQSKPESSVFMRPLVSLLSFSEVSDEPVNCTMRTAARLTRSLITGPLQLMKSISSLGSPQKCMNRMNCSTGIPMVLSVLTTGLLPTIAAPNICMPQISRGKLKGEMTATGPYGHLYPCDCCPRWSPATVKPRHRKRTESPLKFSRKVRMMVISPLHCAYDLGMTLWMHLTKKSSTSGSCRCSAAFWNTRPYIRYLSGLLSGLCRPLLGTFFRLDTNGPNSSLVVFGALMNGSPLSGSTTL